MTWFALLFGPLCALGIFVFMVHVGVMANRFMVKQNPTPNPLKDLLSAPDGVVSRIQLRDGVHLRGFHKGSGPAIVLLHDFGLPINMMTQLWRHLAPMGFRVIAFDMRGHGQSEGGNSVRDLAQLREDLAEVLAFYRVEDGLLLGQAGGALVGLSYLQTYGQAGRIQGMVSLAGFAANRVGGFPAQGLKHRLLGKKWFQSLLRSPWYGSGFANTAFGPQVNSTQVRAYLELLQAQPAKRFKALFAEMATLDEMEKMAQIQTPLILLAGRQDQRVHPIHSLRMARRLPQAEVEILEERGHMLCWEAAKWIAEKTRTFHRSLIVPLEEAN